MALATEMSVLSHHLCRLPLTAIILAVVLCVFLYGSVASAQVVIDNIVDTSLNRYNIRFTAAGAAANSFVLSTFILLATIEFTWGMIRTYMNNGGLQDFMSEIVKRIMFIGFFFYLLQRGSQTINEILGSIDALLVSTGISDGSLSPGYIFDRGQALLAQLYEKATSIGVFDIVFDDDISLSQPVILLFVGMFAMLIMIVIAAHFAIVLLETYIAANAGLILLALGGSRWTHKYAVAYIKYGLSVGMKLFILSIIVGLTLGEIDLFLNTVDTDNLNNLFALVAFLLFSAVISIIAPKSVKSMMDGVSVASGASVANALSTSNRTTRATSRTTGQLNKSLLPHTGQR